MGLNTLRLRCLVALPLLAAGITSAVAPGANATRAVAASHEQQSPSVATAARQIYVNESSHLHLVSNHGTQVLNEQGPSSGTPGGSITVYINISYTQATISFTAHPSGGTLSGHGEASFYARGAIAHFQGTVSVTHGTGKYSHASASSLNIQGTLERERHYALNLKVTGNMHI